MNTEFQFRIKGENGHFLLKIISVIGFPEQTFHRGGYDTDSFVEIELPNYIAKGRIFVTTYEMYSFYKQLEDRYQSLQGHAKLTSGEENITLSLAFDKSGHIDVSGTFRASLSNNTELSFELFSDQSYLQETLNSLKSITDAFGDQFGKKNSP